MSWFVLDTHGDNELLEKEDDIQNSKVLFSSNKSETTIREETTEDIESDSDEGSEKDYGGLPPPSQDISHIISKHLNCDSHSVKNTDRNYFQNSFSFSTLGNSLKAEDIEQNLDGIISTDSKAQLANSILKNIEKSTDSLELISKRKDKKLKKIERERTKGSNWFNMPSTEVTDEIENDLKILQMRSILNPKRFYKKNDLKVLPKYFQVGTVQHSHLEFHNEKHTRRNKKKTMVDELLADAEVKKYAKRKYQEIIEKKQRYNHKKAMKKMKKLKKK